MPVGIGRFADRDGSGSGDLWQLELGAQRTSGRQRDLFDRAQLAAARGAFFSDRDINASAKVCVIGQTIVEKLFQTTDPIGETIRIKRVPFVVIGVLQRKGANMVGQDQDNIVMAPYTTVKKRLSGSTFDNVDFIVASARSPSLMADAQHEIRALLHERHHIRPGEADDFTVQDTAEIANVLGLSPA